MVLGACCPSFNDPLFSPFPTIVSVMHLTIFFSFFKCVFFYLHEQ